MPGRDRSGPLGADPGTGRGIGYCIGLANPGPGFQSEFGFGGRGWRHRFYATGVPGWIAPTPEQETADLRAQAEWLKAKLDAIQKRIEEIESK